MAVDVVVIIAAAVVVVAVVAVAVAAAVVAAVVAAPSRSQILIFASSVFHVDLSNYTLAEFSACFHESKSVCTTKKKQINKHAIYYSPIATTATAAAIAAGAI